MIKAKNKCCYKTLKASLMREKAVGGEEKNFSLYNVEQVVHGATCDILINDAGIGEGNDMLLGEIIDGKFMKIYLVEE